MGTLWWIVREAISDLFGRKRVSDAYGHKQEHAKSDFPLWLVREEIGEADLASNDRKSMYPVTKSLTIGGLVFDASIYLHHWFREHSEISESLGVKKYRSSMPAEMWRTGDPRQQENTISKLFSEPTEILLNNSDMKLLSTSDLVTLIAGAWALGASFIRSDPDFARMYDEDMQSQRPGQITVESVSASKISDHSGLNFYQRVGLYKNNAARWANLRDDHGLVSEIMKSAPPVQGQPSTERRS